VEEFLSVPLRIGTRLVGGLRVQPVSLDPQRTSFIRGHRPVSVEPGVRPRAQYGAPRQGSFPRKCQPSPGALSTTLLRRLRWQSHHKERNTCE
jgi:hypothetical protein